MIKIKNIIGILALSALTVACSEDTMDRINKDNAHPGAETVNAKFQVTDAIVSSVFTTNTGNLAWYVSIYTEQTFGTGNNQAKNAELRNTNETAASTTFNNEWNGTYANLMNIYQMMDKCKDGGLNAGQLDIKGMAEVLAAYNWGIMTDLFGDIPCSEALQSGISAPALDSQEDIYKTIISLLDSAIEDLQKASDEGMTYAKSQDVLYNGDLKQWLGLAHGLKARYLLHKMGRDNSVLSTVVSEANAAIQAGFKDARLDVFDGDAQINAWSAYWYSRDYIGSTTTVDNLMTERNDPRESLYNWDAPTQWYGNPSLGLGVPGNQEQATATYSLPVPYWLYNGVAGASVGSHLFSTSELYFILAEAKIRLGQDGKADFQAAVKAALADYAYACSTEFSDEEVAAYLEGIDSKYTASPLTELFVQKYLAQARDEQLETYNDMRRCKYVDGSYAVALTNPNNTNSAGANRWPVRLPYGNSDVLSNPKVAAAFGSGNDAGMYIFTENVWWAGGSK